MIFNIVVFLVVLGLLIFVHELGHFLAAKMCGIYVDRFSLGFPPRLFGFKWRETDYCVGALPLGGYVKMAGQEDAPLSEEEREKTYGHVPSERWFNNKPRYQRAFVLIAGPAMNLVLGFVLYLILVGFGGEVPLVQVDNRIGQVLEDSAAAEAPLYEIAADGSVDYTEADATGWKTGDRILRVNGNPVNGILQDVAIEAVLNDGELVELTIERPHQDGTSTLYESTVRPRLAENEEFAKFGVEPFDAALIGRVRPGMPAEAAGLLVNDEIVRANGQWVDKNTFARMVSQLAPGQPVDIEVKRGGESISMTIDTNTRGRIEGIALNPSGNPLLGADDTTRLALGNRGALVQENPSLRGAQIVELKTAEGAPVSPALLAELAPDSVIAATMRKPARLWGLLGSNDTVTTTTTNALLLEALTGFPPDQKPVVADIDKPTAEATRLKRRDVIAEIDGQPATSALLRKIESERIGQSVPVKVERPAILRGLYQKAETFDSTLEVASVQEIGVIYGVKTVYHKVAPSEIVPEAWRRSVSAVERIGMTLRLLVTGGLSPDLLGGPVMIYQMVTTSARTNFVLFVDFVAFISINLAIFNLLPLPVLDGGQLTFIAIEAIRRKPVSVRVMETVQQVGLLLIIGLMVYVTFNDVGRLLTNILP